MTQNLIPEMLDPIHLYIKHTESAFSALKVIENGNIQISLVVDDQNRLIGTLTDGDIRRGLLRGHTLEAKVTSFMNSQFTSLRNDDDRSKYLKTMELKNLRHLPILDKKGRVIELLFRNEFDSTVNYPNTVVIMAGGKGTRLRPLTENCPKPMLPVNGQPMLEILLEHCIANGFRNFYFSVNYLKEQVIDYFKDGSKWNVSINYLQEDLPLGTAGSLKLLPSNISHPILVMNGDVLTRFNPSDLINYHNEYNPSATLCVCEHKIDVQFGVVEANGIELTRFEEKPSYQYLVNAGVYVINPELLSLIEPNETIDMPTLLSKAQHSGDRIIICPIHEYWIDIGRRESLDSARLNWISKSLFS